MILCLSGTAPLPASGLGEARFDHAGASHPLLIYSPFLRSPGYGQLPAVIVLHGDNATHNDMIRLTFGRFNELADEEEFYVVYPQAPDNHWLADIDYNLDLIRTLADQLPALYPVDRRRIYLAGMAAGGALTLQLACIPDQPFKALAAVSAGLPGALSDNCKTATQPPPVMLISPARHHQSRANDMTTARRTVRLLRRAGGCSGKRDIVRQNHRTDDGTRVIRMAYTDCVHGAGLTWLNIAGGGYTWPDGWQYRPVSEVGRTSHEINAAAEIWSFFSENK